MKFESSANKCMKSFPIPDGPAAVPLWPDIMAFLICLISKFAK